MHTWSSMTRGKKLGGYTKVKESLTDELRRSVKLSSTKRYEHIEEKREETEKEEVLRTNKRQKENLTPKSRKIS